MSLLSTPTGRPDRVFSLVSLVRALGGRVSSSDAIEWLAPQYRSADSSSIADPERASKTGDRVREVFRVARDLNLVDSEQDDWVGLQELPSTRRAFARHVHSHLCGLPSDDPDAVMLRAYAWCVAYAEGHGIAALVGMSAKDFAREIAAALGRKSEGDDEKAFNPTKLPAWKDWMAFLGLGWNDLPGISGFVPDPSRRLTEDLDMLTPSHARADASSFIARIASTFPYLDGGALFEEAFASGLRRPPSGQLSLVLSQAIRALEDTEVLRCKMEGDSKTGIALFPDPLSSINAFSHVEPVRVDSHV